MRAIDRPTPMNYVGPRTATQRNWFTPSLFALTFFIAFLPLVLIPGSGDWYFFLLLPFALIAGICLLIYSAARRKLSVALLVPAFWALSALVVFHDFQIRTFVRWTLFSWRYKAQVAAQPEAGDGTMKHIEWDGWGWGGQDFSFFLVFDPTDSLSQISVTKPIGKARGLPCDVSDIRQIDQHWYIVRFDAYVSQSDWTNCQ